MSRRASAEGLGTSLLLYVIVGSGIAAETLGRDQAGQLIAHALTVGLALGVLILLFQTVSGSHFNPAVTLGFWRTGTLTGREAVGYAIAQVVGALAGVAAANISFQQAPLEVSTTARTGVGLVFAEAIGTFVLVFVILALVRLGKESTIPAAVGAWVAAIVFATSSTGFANPAVTLSRVFTDTYAGIDPASVPAFLVAQVLAGFLAAYATRFFFPDPANLNTTDLRGS
ncbi:MAG: aquaporin family protein [Actinobacteria bacterium]|nr:MAG: aquaporin family protein [Actinomycetota bacterium]